MFCLFFGSDDHYFDPAVTGNVNTAITDPCRHMISLEVLYVFSVHSGFVSLVPEQDLDSHNMVHVRTQLFKKNCKIVEYRACFECNVAV